MTPPDYIIEDILAIEVDTDSARDLRDDFPSAAIRVQASLRGHSWTVDENCHLYGVDVPIIFGSIYCAALLVLDIVGEHS